VPCDNFPRNTGEILTLDVPSNAHINLSAEKLHYVRQ